MVGMLLAFLAACVWGVGAVLARLGLQHLPSGGATLLSMVAGLLLVFSIALIVNLHDVFAVSAVAFGWIALLGFITYTMGRQFNYRGIALAGVARAAPVIATSPLVAVFWAVSVGDEELQLLTLLGTFFIVAGLSLILSERPI